MLVGNYGTGKKCYSLLTISKPGFFANEAYVLYTGLIFIKRLGLMTLESMFFFGLVGPSLRKCQGETNYIIQITS